MHRALILGIVILLAGVAPAFADIYDVDRTDDDASKTACTAAAMDCTLRGAIIKANAHMGADVINLLGVTYTLSINGTGEDAAATGDLDITDDLTLTGVGAATTIIDAAGLGDRVFQTDPTNTDSITVTI